MLHTQHALSSMLDALYKNEILKEPCLLFLFCFVPLGARGTYLMFML